ncbi:MAG: hypothetical protein JJ979_25365 [Roseibium sp.]|nr:hypothetical protein [Roseibium sp.]
MWTADDAWTDKTVVCVAGGPSLDLRQVRAIGMARSSAKVAVIAVNDAIYPCWFADTLYACDAKWWRYHFDVVKFPGEKISGEKVPFWAVEQVTFTGHEGFDHDNADGIRTGGNSGYQALQIAVKRGAKRVLLAGFDMHDGDNVHWFGSHPESLAMSPSMHRRRQCFNALAEACAGLGVQVVNCSPGSALKAFRAGRLEVELQS